MTSLEPATLDRDGIARRLPHRGRMCLLDRLEHWSQERIHCGTASHTAADNPLRGACGLLSPCAIEYAAQAMALHGALLAPPGFVPRAGYLASVRDVRLGVRRLDQINGVLHVHAERLAGDASGVAYRFHIDDERGARLVEGRATVVLNPPAQSVVSRLAAPRACR